MIPSSSSTARRTTQSSARRRRRRNNAAAASAIRLRGSGGASASARALAAGLWRLRHASVSAAAQTQAPQKLKARRREACHHLCNGNRRRHLAAGTAAGSHCQCVHSRNHHYRGILDKVPNETSPTPLNSEFCILLLSAICIYYSIAPPNQIDACVELEWPPAACCAANSSMEKATKWDGAADDIIFASHSHSHQHHRSAASSPSPLLVLMEAELEKARGQVSELEEERRVMTKRLERFLRRLSEEKAAWKARVRDKARRAVAALSEDLSNERRHRRQLEQANAKLLRELAEARSSAKQQAQSYETERKARELMEEACSELTREVEEDQAEVELLRRECLRMREDMEEERRMLQMAEVWREERVQMKLSDAKLALESKYTQLNRLQAEMEAFLRTKAGSSSCHSSALPQRANGDPAPSAGRSRGAGPPQPQPQVDVDSVFEHFRRKESSSNKDDGQRHSSPAASSRSNSNSNSNTNSALQSVSPATDLFLANIDDDDDQEMEYDGGRDSSCSWVGTSDRSAASIANGNGTATEARSSGASRRSLGKNNTALIRRLWRSAITESRGKTGGGRANGWSPASDRRSNEAPPPPHPAAPAVVVAGEQRGCSSSGSGWTLPQQHGHGHGHGRQSLKEKLMAARMDDQKPLHAVRQKP